jgi:hypothetical protein
VRNSAAIFAAKGVRRIWPRVMSGIIFLFEAAWILLLLYLSIALTRLTLRRLGGVVPRRREVRDVAQIDF